MVRINLLPVRVSKKKERGTQELLLLALILLGVVIANVWYNLDRTAEVQRLQQDVSRTRAKVAELDKIIGEVNKIGQQQEELKKKLEVLDQLKQGRTGPVRMLDELATLTPKRLSLRKLDEKAGKVTFTGTASNVDDVSQFMAALKSSKYFANVELKKTEGKVQAPFRVVDFTIVCTSKYAPGVEDAAAASGPGGKGGAKPAASGKAGG